MVIFEGQLNIMFRKSISYVFLLIANIVLLVHAVVPHHYHQWQVCVESSHCKRDGITHHQDSSANPHEHDEADSSACALKQAVILPANQDKQVSRNLDRNDNHSHDFVFVLWNVSRNNFV